MFEHEMMYCMTLQQKLKRRIKGRIFVKVTANDELLVVVEKDDEFTFRVFIKNFTREFLNGTSTNDMYIRVMAEYKKFISERISEMYFYAS